MKTILPFFIAKLCSPISVDFLTLTRFTIIIVIIITIVVIIIIIIIIIITIVIIIIIIINLFYIDNHINIFYKTFILQ